MSHDILETAVRLREAGEPFVLATVVAVEKPTSARPGAKAIVTESLEWTGWIGGSCSRPAVESEVRRVLASGSPCLVRLSSTETCASGGSLHIFLEPHLPKPNLVIVGHLPVAEALAELARPFGFRVTVMAPGAEGADLAAADVLMDRIDFTDLRPGKTYVVITTHGSTDEQALEAVSKIDTDYVALVASKKRAEVLGVPENVKCPAGLDIGAVTPEEIALSILAELVSVRRAPQKTPEPAGAKDPICGMMVGVEDARYTLTRDDETFYFCSRGCKETYEKSHAR